MQSKENNGNGTKKVHEVQHFTYIGTVIEGNWKMNRIIIYKRNKNALGVYAEGNLSDYPRKERSPEKKTEVVKKWSAVKLNYQKDKNNK